jgi:hypothetical protein
MNLSRIQLMPESPLRFTVWSIYTTAASHPERLKKLSEWPQAPSSVGDTHLTSSSAVVSGQFATTDSPPIDRLGSIRHMIAKQVHRAGLKDDKLSSEPLF